MKQLINLLVLLPFLTIGQTQNQNYVHKKTYKVASKVTIVNPTSKQALQVVDYFDGIGRPIQQLVSKQSASGGNIIKHIEYDSFGNSTREYLPYKSDNSGLDFESDAQNSTLNYPDYYGQNPYSEKLLSNSPASNVLKQSAPGLDWIMGGGKEIKFDYKTNVANEVKHLYATAVWNSNLSLYLPSLVDNGFFPAEILYKTITKDENWIPIPSNLNKDHTTEEFKDKLGKLILKRAYNNNTVYDTYYVYDQYGNLTFVLPPAVTNVTTQLDGLCYQYKYDDKNRLIEKKLPGKEWEFILYDKLDRVVATGPTLNPFGDGTTGWLIVKYDVFDRVVYTGWAKGGVNNMFRKTLQSQFNSTTNLSETKSDPISIDGIQVNYTNNVNLIVLEILLTINYYDDYNFPHAITPIPTLLPDSNLPIATNVKGLSTGSWVRVLDMLGSNSAEKSYTLYDKKYRPVKTHTTNHYGGYTEINSNLNWQGNPLYILTKHKPNIADTEITITDRYTYTDQDKVELQTHQINNLNVELIAKNTYDELGHLISKNVGGLDTSGDYGLQKVDYSYNIRGWLTGINNIEDITSENDLFAFKINYNTYEQTGSSDVAPDLLYNGNISSTYWKTSSDNMIRKYNYSYDKLNRLLDATYLKTELNTSVNSYKESLTYDKNGNIQTLKRNGDLDATNFTIEVDDLTYTYNTNNLNQLLKVTDATNHPFGFKDDNIGGVDYTYDDNGNLLSDANKSIYLIRYNHLNLPTSIGFVDNTQNIDYIYNALGEKIKKTINYGSTSGYVFNSTDYLDGFQYVNGVLSFFPHPEGYVNVLTIKPNKPKQYNYVFNYTDHLGNVRLSYYGTNQATVLEENNYYPFGLKHSKYNSDVYNFVVTDIANGTGYNTGIELAQPSITGPPAYKYKYNGKEFQDELSLNLYDYGARNYDPAIGRWMNIDPLAEISRRWSPYNYAMNNPVYFIDPDGMKSNKFGLSGENVEEEGDPIDPPKPGQGTKSGYMETTDPKTGAPTGNVVEYALDEVIVKFKPKASNVSGDGLNVYGFGGDAVAGSGNMEGDRGTGSIQADGSDLNMLFDFSQLLVDSVKPIFTLAGAVYDSMTNSGEKAPNADKNPSMETTDKIIDIQVPNIRFEKQPNGYSSNPTSRDTTIYQKDSALIIDKALKNIKTQNNNYNKKHGTKF